MVVFLLVKELDGNHGSDTLGKPTVQVFIFCLHDGHHRNPDNQLLWIFAQEKVTDACESLGRVNGTVRTRK